MEAVKVQKKKTKVKRVKETKVNAKTLTTIDEQTTDRIDEATTNGICVVDTQKIDDSTCTQTEVDDSTCKQTEVNDGTNGVVRNEPTSLVRENSDKPVETDPLLTNTVQETIQEPSVRVVYPSLTDIATYPKDAEVPDAPETKAPKAPEAPEATVILQTVIEDVHTPELSALPPPKIHVREAQLSYAMRPFTRAQLQAFFIYSEYSIATTKALDEFVDFELRHERRHRLHALLVNYLTVKKSLTGVLDEIQRLQDDLTKAVGDMWTVQTKTNTTRSACKDFKYQTHSVSYLEAKLNEQALNNTKLLLDRLNKAVNHDACRYITAVKVRELEIENLINDLTNACICHKKSTIGVQWSQDVQTSSVIAEIKLCLSILFAFERSHARDDKEFLDLLHKCVRQLASVIIRVATWKDHLFLLNHILRFPNRLIPSFIDLIQIPLANNPRLSVNNDNSNESPFSDHQIDHLISALTIMLMPIRERQAFLAINQPETFVVLDVNDDDDDDDSMDDGDINESCLIALLNQVPFELLFRRVLCVMQRDGKYVVSGQRINEQYMVELLAWCSCYWLPILTGGLVLYGQPRYKSLAMLLARLIAHTSAYVTDMLIFATKSRNAMFERVKIEYDMFIVRAFQAAYSSRALGTLQFVASMPFGQISSGVVWLLYYLLFDDKHFNDDVYASDLPTMNFDERLDDEFVQQTFEERLLRMSDNELAFFVQIISNIVMARDIADANFIRRAILDLTKFGFVREQTREICAKPVRDVLAVILKKHPTFVSDVVAYFADKHECVGKLSLYLFAELSLHVWQPTDADFDILARNLTLSTLASHENQFARFVLSRLNWGFDHARRLVLSHANHVRVAHLLVRASMHHHETAAKEHMERWYVWAWKLVSLLHLHVFDLDVATVNVWLQDPIAILKRVPDVDDGNVLCKATKKKIQIASYVALMTTQWGLSVPLICTKGFPLLKTLENDARFTEMIASLYFIVPIFVTCAESINASAEFLKAIEAIINTDNTYSKMTQNLLVTSEPGECVRKLGVVINNHCLHYARYGLTSCERFVDIWLTVLTSFEYWNRNASLLYLIDVVVANAFASADSLNTATRIFNKHLQVQICSAQERLANASSLNTILSWVSGVDNSPTILTDKCYHYAHLCYVIIDMEYREMEVNSGLRDALLAQVGLTNKCDVADVLKTAAKNVNSMLTDFNNLAVYRWANLALTVPVKCELFAFVWAKFVVVYAERVGANKTATNFLGGLLINAKSKLLTRMHARINETKAVGCFDGEGTTLVERIREGFSSPSAGDFPRFSTSALKYITTMSQNHYVTNVELERKRSHATNDMDMIFNRRILTEMYATTPTNACNTLADDPLSRISRRLEMYDRPRAAPNHQHDNTRVKDAQKSWDNVNKCDFMKNEIDLVVQHARNNSIRLREYSAFACRYLELVPKIYYDEVRTYRKVFGCGSQCKGSATLDGKYTESRLNERVFQQKEENYALIKLAITKTLSHTPVDLYATIAFVREVIQHLQTRIQQSRATETEQIQKLGATLFYALANAMTTDVKVYPPVHDLFTKCLKQLGTTCIANWDCETYTLITNILNNPKCAKMLVDYLNPPTDASNFLKGYILLVDKVTKVKSKALADDTLLMMFATFDVAKWLASRRTLAERTELINAVMLCLSSLGVDVNVPTSQLYKHLIAHLLLVFHHDWPEHYGEILKKLLRLHKDAEMNVHEEVWFDLLKSLQLTNPKSDNLRDELRYYASKQTLLKHEELVQSVSLLHQYFRDERLQFVLYGLYPRYRKYTKPLSTLLAALSHALIVTTMQQYPVMLANQICEKLWPQITDLHAPWIVCYNAAQPNVPKWLAQVNATPNKALVPFIQVDADHARLFVAGYTLAVHFLVDMLPACTNLFSYVWQFYATQYAFNCVTDHVLAVVNAELITLPWEKFWPSIHDTAVMLKVFDTSSLECQSFCVEVILRIAWTPWLDAIWRGQSSNATDAFVVQRNLLPLFVKLSNHPHVKKSTIKMKQIIEDASKFTWNLVDVKTFEDVCVSFASNGNASVVINTQADQLNVHVWRLLCASAEFQLTKPPINKYPIETSAKRRIVVREYVNMLTFCATSTKTIKRDVFFASITEMLARIDAVLGHIPKPLRDEDANALLSGLFSLFKEKSLRDIVTDATCAYLNENANSSVLAPILSTDAIAVNGAEHVCRILECAIDCYFVTCANASWFAVLGMLQNQNVWKMRTTVTVAAKCDCVLLVHAIVRLRDKYDSCRGNIHELLAWINAIKPTSSTEAKLPLIWNDFLKEVNAVCMDAIRDNNDSSLGQCVGALRGFVRYLTMQSEVDGWGASLLGVVGIKNKETFSLRGKFLCKSLALYISSQLFKDNETKIRCASCSDAESVSLDSLRNTKADLKVHADFVTREITNRENSMHNVSEFLENISTQLYNQTYLSFT